MNTGAPDVIQDYLLPWVRVSEIQTKLHQWAVDDPNRRFDDLYNFVYDT